jgi:hypothetical protein
MPKQQFIQILEFQNTEITGQGRLFPLFSYNPYAHIFSKKTVPEDYIMPTSFPPSPIAAVIFFLL